MLTAKPEINSQALMADNSKIPRDYCIHCLKSLKTCLCNEIEPIDTDVKFVFLMHRKEHRDRLGTGTGRLSHLMLKESHLFVGLEFDDIPEIKKLLQDTAFFPCILYPSNNAINVSSQDGVNLLKNISNNKKLLIFVLDGSWACVKKIIKTNNIIASLPSLSFITNRMSAYKFKKQPRNECLSTIEAVHELLSVFEHNNIAHCQPIGAHEKLFSAFQKLVKVQSSFIPNFNTSIEVKM